MGEMGNYVAPARGHEKSGGPWMKMKARDHLRYLGIRMRAVVGQGALVVLLAGCGGVPDVAPTSGAGPSLQAERDEFENPGTVSAADILPADLLAGPHHTVSDEAVMDGLFPRFTITSQFGRYRVRGAEMLRIRVNEIQALATKEDLTQDSAFGAGVLHTLSGPFVFLKNLITEPIDTLVGVPQGIWRMMMRIGEMTRGKRGELEESEAQELIGYSLVKRRLALELGVDPYSSNESLQEELSRLSVAGYAGGMGSRLLTIPLTGPAAAVTMGTSFGSVMNEFAADQAPEDLRRSNREMLKKMGVRESIKEEFLQQPWFSPSHETGLIRALTEMDRVKGRSRLVEAALGAGFEAEALFYQRCGEMMAGFHHRVARLKFLSVVQRRFILGYSADHALVVTLPLAYIPWTREVAGLATALMQWNSGLRPVKRVELWVTGQLTPRARRELEARGFMLYEGVADRLMPPPSPPATDQPVSVFDATSS